MAIRNLSATRDYSRYPAPYSPIYFLDFWAKWCIMLDKWAIQTEIIGEQIMKLTAKSMSYVNVYEVKTTEFLSAGIDSGTGASAFLVLAKDTEEAMEIVRGFYNRPDIKNLKFKGIEELGQAMYVLDLLKSKC